MKNLKKYSDIELCELIAESKEPEKSEAFTEVYERYCDNIYLYCKKLFNGESFADDIFQDTFLQLLKTIEKRQPIENIKGYLLKTSRNLAINLKRKKVNNTIDINDLNLIFDDKNFDSIELSELIDSALDLLPDEHKESFVLQSYHGLSYSEIAIVTEVPVSTVRNRVVRAKCKLKEILSPVMQERNQGEL